MKLATANIQNFPDHPASQVAQDASTVAASCTLAGLQEIQPHEDTPVIRGALGDDWWMVGRHLEVPIIGREDRWELLDHYVVPFKRPKLPRPQNPHGGIVTAIVRTARNRLDMPAFAVVNTHLVSGGHNGPKLPVVAQRWEEEFQLLHATVSGLHGSGFTVFVVGDLNDPRPPKIGPRFQWLSPMHSPDHLGQLVHSGGVQLVDPTHKRVPLNSDHDCHVISGPLRHADD